MQQHPRHKRVSRPHVLSFLEKRHKADQAVPNNDARNSGYRGNVQRHDPAQSTSCDQDALGIVLPATAEPEGYTAEKAKGNIRVLPAQEQVQLDMIIGTLSPTDAAAMEDEIEQILAS